MSINLSGGCEHINTKPSNNPIDNHTCNCSVCKSVTGQPTTHVAFFNHNDLIVNNPEGPLELCKCSNCGTPIMLDDKMGRIRVMVPNIMGYDPNCPSATYHAFYDPSASAPKPNDGRPVSEGLRSDFVWPPGK